METALSEPYIVGNESVGIVENTPANVVIIPIRRMRSTSSSSSSSSTDTEPPENMSLLSPDGCNPRLSWPIDARVQVHQRESPLSSDIDVHQECAPVDSPVLAEAVWDKALTNSDIQVRQPVGYVGPPNLQFMLFYHCITVA